MNRSNCWPLIANTLMFISLCGWQPALAQYAGNGQPEGSYDNGFQPGGMAEPVSNQTAATSRSVQVSQWFNQYDQIRRQAQMSPQERQQADYFLSKITAIFVPGQEKLDAKNLLTRMVSRYRQASIAIKQLPMLPQTIQLQKGYYRYFVTAGNLFIDYLKVQDNLLTTDPNTGQPIAGQLMQRKAALEELNVSIQSLDQQLRNRLGIPAYRYQPPQ